MNQDLLQEALAAGSIDEKCIFPDLSCIDPKRQRASIRLRCRSEMLKEQWEVDAKDRFVRFLLQTQYGAYTATGEDVVSNPVSGKNFDFELTPAEDGRPVIALEIFRLFGQDMNYGQQRVWSQMTERLTVQLETLGVRGYLIETPLFNVPKSKRKQFVSDTARFLADLIARNSDQQKFSDGGYTVSNFGTDHPVVFASIGGVRQIYPFESASDALANLLPTKNEQLNVQGRQRTLLIVNTGIFPHGGREVRRFFSTEDLAAFPNIDQAFFEVSPDEFLQVFDRRVLSCFRDQVLPHDSRQSALFIPFIEQRLSVRDRDALIITKLVFDRDGNLNTFSDHGKDALISFGESLAQAEEWWEVLWIVDALKNDPDPPFPNDRHEQLAKGESYPLITSVRGRLCWLIQKLALYIRIDSYSPMLDILEGYAFGPDFYIRTQALVPLVQMAVHRLSRLPDGNRYMREDLADRIKAIALKMLRDSENHTVLLEEVSSLFRWVRDLSSEEVREVLDPSVPCGEAAALGMTKGRGAGEVKRCCQSVIQRFTAGSNFQPFQALPFVIPSAAASPQGTEGSAVCFRRYTGT